MAYNVGAGDRDQAFLLPPDVREWLPAGHLAWFVLDVVDQLDLGPFPAAYEPMGTAAPRSATELLAVLLSGYCTAVRTSGQLERRRHEDLAFQVLAGNTTLDHGTLARFRVRHEQALAGLLVQSLKLCAAAGMGAPGPGRLGRHQGRGQRRPGGQRRSHGPGRRAALPSRRCRSG
jgi:transposase